LQDLALSSWNNWSQSDLTEVKTDYLLQEKERLNSALRFWRNEG
jgi:hypothetical protein